MKSEVLYATKARRDSQWIYLHPVSGLDSHPPLGRGSVDKL